MPYRSRGTVKHASSLETKIRAPTVELHSLSTTWPFHTWALYLVGPINPPSRGFSWILAATECYTKWVETTALKKASASTVANFIRENVIYRFGILKCLLSDNGKPFVNFEVRQCARNMGLITSNQPLSTLKGTAKQRLITRLY